MDTRNQRQVVTNIDFDHSLSIESLCLSRLVRARSVPSGANIVPEARLVITGLWKEQVEEVGRYLESRLAVPVTVRSFSDEDSLYTNLTRFSEIDAAWAQQTFPGRLPVNSHPWSEILTFLPGRAWRIRGPAGAGRGVAPRLRAALLGMHELAGQTLLANRRRSFRCSRTVRHRINTCRSLR